MYYDLYFLDILYLPYGKHHTIENEKRETKRRMIALLSTNTIGLPWLVACTGFSLN
jgi:hypothetical protein